VLTYNPAVTKVLWKRSDQPMVMALVISMVWHNLAVNWCRDIDTKRQLKNSAMYVKSINLLSHKYFSEDEE
jgi:hypothetical protein